MALQTPIRVLHLTMGSSKSVGGIASVIREIQRAASVSQTVNAEIFWKGDDPLQNQLRTRTIQRTNRLCSQSDQSPYRYPGFERASVPADLTRNADVLHIHRPEFLDTIARMKSPRPAVVVHAHSILGFSGGCVLESQCSELINDCRHCPIVRKAMKWLPRRGLQARSALYRKLRPIIVANSQFTRSCVARSPLMNHVSCMRVITPGVDVNTFYPNCENINDRGATRIGMVAASLGDANKQLAHFAAVGDRLRKRYDIELYAAGEASDAVKTMYPSITFVGPRSGAALRDFYAALDVLVVPSRSESFGIISIEAQFCHVPVVAYRTGGLTETILEDQTGRLAEPNNVDDLARQTSATLEDRDRRFKFHSEHVKNFLEPFTVDAIARQYESLYHDMSTHPR